MLPHGKQGVLSHTKSGVFAGTIADAQPPSPEHTSTLELQVLRAQLVTEHLARLTDELGGLLNRLGLAMPLVEANPKSEPLPGLLGKLDDTQIEALRRVDALSAYLRELKGAL